MTKNCGFNGVQVVSLESRRAVEMGRLIKSYGGVPRVAPSMREAPIERNQNALEFAAQLLDGQFDMMIFLTGVGTRMLTKVVETRYPREEFVEALTKVKVVARGPKPVAALKELRVPIDVSVPEPNTWRELLQAIEPVPAGLRIAVQEYGKPNPELIQGLRHRGAQVTSVPVYQWELPEDTGPLRQAIREMTEGRADVAMFTTSVQVPHLFKIAAEMQLEDLLRKALSKMMVASVGPISSEALLDHSVHVDMEPSHPKMGFLVKEAAEQSARILTAKRMLPFTTRRDGSSHPIKHPVNKDAAH